MDSTTYIDVYAGLEKNAFEVLKVPFKMKDLIQSVLYLSSSCNNVIENYFQDKYFNSFMFTIDVKTKSISASIGHCTKSTSYFSSSNACYLEENIAHFYLSTGFLLDHFNFKKPKEGLDLKYLSKESGTLTLTHKDLETLLQAA